MAVFFGAEVFFAFLVGVDGLSVKALSTCSDPEFTVLACTGMESAPINRNIPNRICSGGSFGVGISH